MYFHFSQNIPHLLFESWNISAVGGTVQYFIEHETVDREVPLGQQLDVHIMQIVC